MKKAVLFIFLLLFIGCNANKEKAEKVIKRELQERLNISDGYKPLNTKIEKAYLTPQNDMKLWKKIYEFYEIRNLSDSKGKEFDYILEQAGLQWNDWSVADYVNERTGKLRQNNPYHQQLYLIDMEMIALSNMMRDKIKEIQNFLKSDRYDSNEIIGYNVTQHFEYIDKNGKEVDSEYYFLLDNDYDLLYLQDLDNPIVQDALRMIEIWSE